MRNALLLLSLLAPWAACGAAHGAVPGPYDAWVAALADASRAYSRGEDVSYYRYVSMHHAPRGAWPDRRRTMDYVANSLGARSQLLFRGVPVRPGYVLRYDLKKLGVSPHDWDAVVAAGSGAVPLPEPNFYVLTRGHRGKELAVSPLVGGPDGGASGRALQRLLASRTPLVLDDWAAAYFLLAPGYYRLLGVADVKGDLAQLDRIAGVDEALAARTRVQAVADSKVVTLHNRLLDRFSVPNTVRGGYKYQSFDTDTGIDDEDYVNSFARAFLVRRNGRRLESELSYKATEVIYSLPNGLHAAALTDAKLKLLNVAVASIAADRRSRYKDVQVWAYRNCLVCHDKQGGLWELDDRVRALSTGRLVLRVEEVLSGSLGKGKAGQIALDIQNAYGLDFNEVIQGDVAKYSVSVLSLTGRTPRENALVYEAMTARYFDAPVTAAEAAALAGWRQDDLLAVLRRANRLDWTLNAFLQEPPVAVPRIAWERQGMAQLSALLAAVELKR